MRLYKCFFDRQTGHVAVEGKGLSGGIAYTRILRRFTGHIEFMMTEAAHCEGRDPLSHCIRAVGVTHPCALMRESKESMYRPRGGYSLWTIFAGRRSACCYTP